MSDAENILDEFADEASAAKHKAKPRSKAKPKADAEPTDNAVDVQDLYWECKCGNTNTHDMTRCGKCNDARYSN